VFGERRLSFQEESIATVKHFQSVFGASFEEGSNFGTLFFIVLKATDFSIETRCGRIVGTTTAFLF
jgi:hypothetical protein